jgi:8-oxo-dGTP pyrophosphatase MutT (NUDIX family)/phosphohistidine phosphatase SixA
MSTVVAAGAILWRYEKGTLKVAIIHRARYDDWSWPKGKIDKGETVAQAAVRELREETGLKVTLGVPLAEINYKLPNGSDKVVHYWAAKVSDKALANSKFKPSEEVAKVDWMNPTEASKLLSYEFDQIPLEKLISLHRSKQLDTKPLIILRHAKAMPRSEWKDGKSVDDGKRPLDDFGKQQAKALVPTISAFGPKSVISSPWLRCKDTVAPYASKKKFAITERHQLSELGNAKRPSRTENVIEDCLTKDRSVILCSHRPSLPKIFETLAIYAPVSLGKSITDSVTLRPGQMLVAHVNRIGKYPKIVAVELQESLLKAE